LTSAGSPAWVAVVIKSPFEWAGQPGDRRRYTPTHNVRDIASLTGRKESTVRWHLKSRRTVLVSILAMVTSCDSQIPENDPRAELVREVRELAAVHGFTALPNASPVRHDLVALGQALAFDKVLSGNRNIACMTCHLPERGTSDGKSLSIGEGGVGLAEERSHPDGVFIPRTLRPSSTSPRHRRSSGPGAYRRHRTGPSTPRQRTSLPPK